MKIPLYSQHAYTIGRSCDTALTEIVDIIERAVSRREKALAVSLDCSGAFDRIRFDAAASAMERKGIPKTIVKWYIKLLKERIVEADLQGVKCRRQTKRGSPQGGILSTLVWILIMDTLLSKFEDRAVKAIGYSDDTNLIVTGKDVGTLVNLMQQALDEVIEWGELNGLIFNPDKTSAVLFTRSTKKELPKPLHIKRNDIAYCDSFKYLGVTFTKRLAWSEHVKSRVKKATQLFNLSKAIIGQNWGLTPERIMWLYTAVIRPMISYGCLVWGKSLNVTARNGLKRIQRQVLLSLAHPLRSTPTDGMEVALGLLPLDLHVEAEATKARLRTRDQTTERWDGLGALRAEGHKRYWDLTLNRLCPVNLPVDKTPKTKNWEPRRKIENPDVIIYTDGSKEGNRVGCGWAACVNETVIAEDSRYLGHTSTVFQAEVTAVSDSLLWLISNPHKLLVRSCLIRSDSLSAIQAVYSNTIESKIVLDCVNFLKRANESFQVGIEWVRGHSDQTGNEYADYLARAGNRRMVEVAEPVIPIPMVTIKAKIDEEIQVRWQKRWEACEGRRVTKHFFPLVDRKKWKRLVRLSRRDINLLLQAGTGHGLFRGHLAKWMEVDAECQLCLEDDEKADHLWEGCPALWRERRTRQDKMTREKYFELDILKFFKTPALRELRRQNEELVASAAVGTVD
jgi:ribonuclease HI